MEWIKLKSTYYGKEYFIRIDDIDNVLNNVDNNRAAVKLKNGDCINVETDLLWNLLNLSENAGPEHQHNADAEGLPDEIQDLKLENDCLKKRDKIMLKFIRSVACINCNDCYFYEKPGCIASVLDNSTVSLNRIFKKKAEEILQELDNL